MAGGREPQGELRPARASGSRRRGGRRPAGGAVAPRPSRCTARRGPRGLCVGRPPAPPSRVSRRTARGQGEGAAASADASRVREKRCGHLSKRPLVLRERDKENAIHVRQGGHLRGRPTAVGKLLQKLRKSNYKQNPSWVAQGLPLPNHRAPASQTHVRVTTSGVMRGPRVGLSEDVNCARAVAGPLRRCHPFGRCWAKDQRLMGLQWMTWILFNHKTPKLGCFEQGPILVAVWQELMHPEWKRREESDWRDLPLPKGTKETQLGVWVFPLWVDPS